MSTFDNMVTFNIDYSRYAVLKKESPHPEIVLNTLGWGKALEKGDRVKLNVRTKKQTFSVTATIVDKTNERLIVALKKE